jgi:hypothetical protein
MGKFSNYKKIKDNGEYISPFLKGEKPKVKTEKDIINSDIDPNYPDGYDPAVPFKTDPKTGRAIPPAKRLHKGNGKPKRKSAYDAIASELPPVKIGRPRKYNDDALEQLANDMLEWFSSDDPSRIWLVDWCIDRGIVDTELHVYASRSIPFAKALQTCKQMQTSKLVRLGLSAKYSASAGMAMFALKNVSGWRDKQEITDQRQQVREVTLTLVNPEGRLEMAKTDEKA